MNQITTSFKSRPELNGRTFSDLLANGMFCVVKYHMDSDGFGRKRMDGRLQMDGRGGPGIGEIRDSDLRFDCWDLV